MEYVHDKVAFCRGYLAPIKITEAIATLTVKTISIVLALLMPPHQAGSDSLTLLDVLKASLERVRAGLSPDSCYLLRIIFCEQSASAGCFKRAIHNEKNPQTTFR